MVPPQGEPESKVPRATLFRPTSKHPNTTMHREIPFEIMRRQVDRPADGWALAVNTCLPASDQTPSLPQLPIPTGPTLATPSRGLVQAVLHTLLLTRGGQTLGACLVLCYLLSRLSPRLRPLEPPILKPRIPLIGHILGVTIQQTEYLMTL